MLLLLVIMSSGLWIHGEGAKTTVILRLYLNQISMTKDCNLGPMYNHNRPSKDFNTPLVPLVVNSHIKGLTGHVEKIMHVNIDVQENGAVLFNNFN